MMSGSPSFIDQNRPMASTLRKEPVVFMCYALYKSLRADFREEGMQEEEKDEAARNRQISRCGLQVSKPGALTPSNPHGRPAEFTFYLCMTPLLRAGT